VEALNPGSPDHNTSALDHSATLPPVTADDDEPWPMFHVTSDVVIFDKNGHHLCSTSAGGKDLWNDQSDWPSEARNMPENAQKVD